MADKISLHLSSLIQKGNSDEQVDLVALLPAGMPDATLADLKRTVQSLTVGEVDHVPISGTLHFRAPLGSVQVIASLDSVEQLDVEATASMEDLLDT